MRFEAAIHHLLRYSKVVALAVCLSTAAIAHAQYDRTGTSNSRDFGGFQTASGTAQTRNSQSNRNRPSDSSAFNADTSATKGLVYVKETPDSVLRKKVFFFNHIAHSVKIDELWNPTLDPTGVQFSDPLDGLNGDFFIGQGTIGHPHLSLFPSFEDGISHSLQSHNLDGYLKTPDNIRFYQTMTPYTVLSYNNSLKKDYLVNVAHTQNIIPGWNFSFDYRLICPEGNLSGSGAKNHYLDATTNYFSHDSRLQVRAGFIWQSMAMEENGGLIDDSYFLNNPSSNLGGLPVRLYNSKSKNLHHDAFVHATYNLVQQVDQYREHDSLVARYDTVTADSIRLLMDTLVVTDTFRVGTPHVINLGVLGVEADYSRWKRAAYITAYSDSSLWEDASASLFWTNDAYPDHRWRNPLKITLGITPRRLHAIVAKDTSSAPDTLLTTAAVNPFAKMELSLWDATLLVEGSLDNTLLGLSPNIKDPDLHARSLLRIPFDSTESNTLELSASYLKQMPEVRILHASNYTFGPILSQYYAAHFQHESDSGLFRLVDLNLGATHMSHSVWFDSTLAVHESTSGLWLYQAALTLRLQWRWLHLDMQQLIQHSTDEDQVSVPLLASKNSLYADFSLFHNALRMQIGTDVRYFSRFAPDGYDPALGILYMQNGEIGDYIWADAFINLQIKRASIYVKAGHFNALWDNHPRYFLLPHYPGSRFGLFWGMTWNFFD